MIKTQFNIIAAILVAVVSSMAFTPAGLAKSEVGVIGFVENKIVASGKVITAGVTPDSILWLLDVAIDRLDLLLTSDATAKAHKSLDIARERLLEVREMAIQNKLDASAKAEAEHRIMLRVAEESSAKMHTNNDKTKALSEIESELEKHEGEITGVKNNMHVKVKTEGNFTEEHQWAVENFMQKMLNSTGEVKLKIYIQIKGELTSEQKAVIDNLAKQFKGDEEVKFRIKVNVIADKIAVDAEDELESLLGVRIGKKEAASDRLEEAKEAFNELKARITALNESNITIKASDKVLFEESRKHLLKAETAFTERNYGEAYGQATAALKLAGNAKAEIEED
ncbi:MAG: hypothetical protein HY361_01125 [Candidatus Aenigmarchaeota archaeon]|nr:hypothetical protein [Candidatus Aenigmarchaeota archaeon]